MMKAGVAQLKAKLSEYLDKVKAGEEVLVLRRGKPVAKIVPIEKGGKEAHEEHIRELLRTGQMKEGKGELPPDFWTRPRPKDPEGLAVKYLIEERRKGR